MIRPPDPRRNCADLPGEEWRWVPGYEGRYQASTLGRLRFTRIIGTGRSCTNGRYVAGLVDSKGHTRRVSVHRVILETFKGASPSPDHMCRHLDGNCLNNTTANLAWGTAQDNSNDMERHGTRPRGERSGTAKLTNRTVLAIRASREPARIVAERYGVGKYAIYAVRQRRTWTGVDGGPKVDCRTGENHRHAKLTDSTVRRMRVLYAFGMSSYALGRKFGVAQTVARDAVSGRSWTHVRQEFAG